MLRERCKRLDLYNPASIGKTFAAVKTVSDCLALQKEGEPALQTICRQGETLRVRLTALIALNIAALDRFLNLKNPLTEEQIDFVADQIVEEFGGALTMADVHVVLRNVKAGKYGKFYERLSAPTILDWFRQYYEARLDAAERYSLNEDARTYRRQGDDVLLSMGYKVGEDGRVQIDRERMAEKEEQRKRDFEEAGRRRQQQIDASNEYMRYVYQRNIAEN